MRIAFFTFSYMIKLDCNLRNILLSLGTQQKCHFIPLVALRGLRLASHFSGSILIKQSSFLPIMSWNPSTWGLKSRMACVVCAPRPFTLTQRAHSLARPLPCLQIHSSVGKQMMSFQRPLHKSSEKAEREEGRREGNEQPPPRPKMDSPSQLAVCHPRRTRPFAPKF